MAGFIAYRNRADSATLSLEPGSAVIEGSLANLQIRQSDSWVRFNTFVLPLRLVIDFGVPIAPKFIGLFSTNRNGSNTALTVEGSATGGGGWVNVPFPHMVPDLSGTPVPFDYKTFYAGAPSYRYWRLTTEWLTFASRLWVSTAEDMVEFPEGMDAAWSIDIEDRSVGDETDAGIYWEDRRARLRRLSFSWSSQTTNKAFGFADGASSVPAVVSSIQAMQMIAGSTGEVVAAVRSDPLWLHRACIRGRFSSGAPRIQHQRGAYWEAAGVVTEEV